MGQMAGTPKLIKLLNKDIIENIIRETALLPNRKLQELQI